MRRMKLARVVEIDAGDILNRVSHNVFFGVIRSGCRHTLIVPDELSRRQAAANLGVPRVKLRHYSNIARYLQEELTSVWGNSPRERALEVEAEPVRLPRSAGMRGRSTDWLSNIE